LISIKLAIFKYPLNWSIAKADVNLRRAGHDHFACADGESGVIKDSTADQGKAQI
jgi:hypothetical protein